MQGRSKAYLHGVITDALQGAKRDPMMVLGIV